MRPRIGEAPPVEIAMTSGLRSTIEGMMKSQSRGRSATLTSAPALFAAARASADRPLVVGRDEAERRALEVLRLRIAGLVPEVRPIEKSAEIVAQSGRERGHAGAGLDEVLPLGAPRPPRRRRRWRAAR